MKSFSATGNIKASPDRIWAILVDVSKYPNWDNWTIRIDGKVAPGAKITAYNKISPDRAFPAKVTEFVPGRKMAWTGGMPLGLFKGVRSFVLSPRSDGSTDFTLREEFSGPLLPMIGGSIPDQSKVFEDFVANLKAYAETR